jgi:hypothetical protein
MHPFTRTRRFFLLKATLSLCAILLTVTAARTQSLNGVNNTGNDGNETIQGTIHFPAGRQTGFQPVIKV